MKFTSISLFLQKNMEEQAHFDSKILLDLINTEMPFGKYKSRPLYILPEAYLVWFKQKGFPNGKLGILLETLYEIKLNGLEYLLVNIRNNQNS